MFMSWAAADRPTSFGAPRRSRNPPGPAKLLPVSAVNEPAELVSCRSVLLSLPAPPSKLLLVTVADPPLVRRMPIPLS